MHNLDDDFKAMFPRMPFSLKCFQKKVIENVLAGENTLCIMPTGGGKSIIYWMSAIELRGITVVVAPLTALISEQAEKIMAQGYSVLELHGNIDAKKQMQELKDLANGNITPDFIFVSPEKIATDGFLEYCLKRRKDDVRLFVIDEVHCVSQWGLNFRPFYKHIPDFLNVLFGEENWCSILALTATLNPKELGDICASFRIAHNNILREEMLMRSEIQLHVEKLQNEQEKEEKLWEIIKLHRDEKILVYVYRKYGDRGVEGLNEFAQRNGYKSAFFHGDMTAQARKAVIERYRTGEINTIFATSAFGMGIDIRDIRVVIHFMVPESAEQYYQEVGRAARDGRGANAYLMYTDKNIEVKRTHFIDRAFPNETKLAQVFEKISKKAGLKSLPYFEDDSLQDCLPYYLEAGLVEIVGKGFSDLTDLKDIRDEEIQRYYDSTLQKGYCRTVKKCGITARELSENVYAAIVDGRVGVSKPLTRWLILDIKATEISNEAMAHMIAFADEKRKYKHELLDYFLYVIENNHNSVHLHQEIAMYLGMDKHQLARIYETIDGNHVRSKSEVIISNLLHETGISYLYEEKLFYEEGRWIEPDFTIKLPTGEELYWEHVGMLGNEEYNSRWKRKLDIYEAYYPGQLIKTYESGALSRDAKRIILNLSKK